MRLWLDDLKPMPSDYDLSVETAQGAIGLLKENRVSHISLDHDLGDETIVGNGYHVACWIERHAHEGDLAPLTWEVHTDNASAYPKMIKALENADKYWRNFLD